MNRLSTARILVIILLITIVSIQIYADNNHDDITYTDGLKSVSSAPEINRFPLPSTSCQGLAFDGEFMWSGEYSTLYKINITDGTSIIADNNSSRRYYSLAWGDNAFWAPSSDRSYIIKFDPITFEEIITFDHPWSTASSLAWSTDGLYVYDDSIDKIYLLNDSSGQVITSYDYYDNIGGIAINNGFLWKSIRYGEQLIKTTIDTGDFISFIDISDISMYLEELTFINNNLWVIDGTSDSLIGYNISGTADLVIHPDQDTYVRSNSDEINGLSTTLYMSDTSNIYLRFPLAQIMNLSSVYLEFYQQFNDILDIQIYQLESDLWDQLTMKWDNRLITNRKMGSISIIGKNWYSFEVTNFINSQSDGWATFVIKTQADTGTLSLNSIESSSSEFWPMLSINGTIYESKIIPGPITASVTETETQTQTQTIVETTTTKTENITKTKTEYITEINTSNITEFLTRTDEAGILFFLPTSLFFVLILLLKRKR